MPGNAGYKFIHSNNSCTHLRYYFYDNHLAQPAGHHEAGANIVLQKWFFGLFKMYLLIKKWKNLKFFKLNNMAGNNNIYFCRSIYRKLIIIIVWFIFLYISIYSDVTLFLHIQSSK